jgi:hypothetical protein
MLIHYYELLARIHQYLRPRTYLEIGVHEGDSLSLALPETIAVGVDPSPAASLPGARIVRATSDEFFAGPDAFGGRPIDLAFIDGLHLFEQALRDFLNVERLASPASTVLVHDCLPIDKETSSRERTTIVWSGDVWKLIVCLRRYRPDLAIATVDVPPTGLAIITNLNPAAPELPVDEACEELMPLDYDDLVALGIDRTLHRVDNDWETVRARLG